jgi:peptide/nickel transport system permease protein
MSIPQSSPAVPTHSPAAPLSPVGGGGSLEVAEATPVEEEVLDARLTVTPQWKLIWWRFRKHRIAIVSVVILGLFYLVALCADFVAPHDPNEVNSRFKLAPPTAITFFDPDGDFTFWPGVNPLTVQRDPTTLRLTYVPDKSVWYPIELVGHGPAYKLWGLIPLDIHLFRLVPQAPDQSIFLLGTDRLGRDLFSRVTHGARLSLSIGLVGVALSFVLGIILGGISGYYGGWIDTAVQRVIEFLRSIPRIPLWMALAAAVPPKWPVEYTYFAITIILSVVGWTGLARVVRGRFLSLREEDFVLAARLCGAREPRIIFRHMLPSFTSHIIASITLAIPGTILGETALSFLGLGLREPAMSWGVLLQDAQNIQAVALAPWQLLPALPLIVTIMAFNFLGDGLRDAADPYGR